MNPEVAYLKSLLAVREQSKLLLQHPHHLNCFTIDLNKLDDVVALVLSLIKRDYASPADIPSHSRWCHFVGIDLLREISDPDPVEQAVSMIDLFLVSVLLDAGAGDPWTYKKGSAVLNRSEGLAVASFDMFKSGAFSSTSKR